MQRMLRQPTERDRDLLAGHGLGEAAGKLVYVFERDGVVTGAMTAVAKPFEIEMLGVPVHQIDTLAAWEDDRDLPAIAREGLSKLREAGGGLVTCRRPESDRHAVAALQAAGMAVIECLVTLERDLKGGGAERAQADIAGHGDAGGVGEVARRAFRFDRFHADARVDDEKADALKAAWARNSVLGRADRVFVTRDGERVTGFNACLLREDAAVIDLIGVHPDYQGRGLGRALVGAALGHYAGRAPRMVVGTQSANHGSLALYQSAGFRIGGSAFTLHAHLGGGTQ